MQNFSQKSKITYPTGIPALSRYLVLLAFKTTGSRVKHGMPVVFVQFLLPIFLFLLSASVVHAQDRPAPYSGFSDEFYYSGGRMTGGQSVYKNLPQTAEPPKSDEHKHNSHAIPEYNYSTQYGYTNRNVIWNVPSPYGFLSPCQAQVQDAINQKTLRNDEIYFSGTPTNGQAVDGQKQRYNYNCQNGDVYIW